MSAVAARLVALAVALVVLAAGSAYTLTRTTTYESSASVVLVPSARTAAELSSAIDSFTSSGTAGTFVELLSSPDTRRAAGDPPVTLTVRAVPDSRVIGVTARGARDVVQPSLRAVLASAYAREGNLRALWLMTPLASPSAPEVAGASTALLLVATVLLAVLAAIATLALLQRMRPSPEEELSRIEPHAVAVPDRAARAGRLR